jgi:hypothetical protein
MRSQMIFTTRAETSSTLESVSEFGNKFAIVASAFRDAAKMSGACIFCGVLESM